MSAFARDAKTAGRGPAGETILRPHAGAGPPPWAVEAGVVTDAPKGPGARILLGVPGPLRRRDVLSAFPWLAAGLALPGCRAIGQAVEEALEPGVADYRFRADQSSDTLLVLVPGATDAPEDIEEHGVIEKLRTRGCEFDIVVPYHLGPAYLFGEAEMDLRRDVIVPAGPRQRRLWLCISAGALVTFGYARQYPADVDRIIAYAPFLGPEKFVDEIEAQGGLATWVPNEPIEDIERIWVWLQGYGAGLERPPLDLLYGTEDSAIRALRVLAETLPEPRVHVGPGEHGWATFMPMFEAFLDANPPAQW